MPFTLHGSGAVVRGTEFGHLRPPRGTGTYSFATKGTLQIGALLATSLSRRSCAIAGPTCGQDQSPRDLSTRTACPPDAAVWEQTLSLRLAAYTTEKTGAVTAADIIE